MIKWVVFDIDGVITDGTVIVDANGTEQKKLNLKESEKKKIEVQTQES